MHAEPSPSLGQAVAPTQNKGRVLVSSVIVRNTFFKTKGCFLLPGMTGLYPAGLPRPLKQSIPYTIARAEGDQGAGSAGHR